MRQRLLAVRLHGLDEAVDGRKRTAYSTPVDAVVTLEDLDA